MKIFEELLKQKIDNFIIAFERTSKEIFLDSDGNLIHPGEFGIYRENVVKDFLKSCIPERLNIGQGFIISKNDDVSQQCDIVIYDARETPLLETIDKQRFFPVETVVAIGEIKSKLTKHQFKEAINKLSKVKKIKENIKNPVIIKKDNKNKYDPVSDPYDQLFTFLICQKFDFDFNNIINDINQLYERGLHYRYRHNLILSIEDGILAYYDNNKVTMMYPYIGKPLKNRWIIPGTNIYNHFKFFADYLFIGTSSSTILYPEFTDYMGSVEGTITKDEM